MSVQDGNGKVYMTNYERIKQWLVAHKKDVENMPAVDAVPVVRCEDCVCYRKVGNLRPYCTLLLREMPAIGYCNYGLRKDLEHGTD